MTMHLLTEKAQHQSDESSFPSQHGDDCYCGCVIAAATTADQEHAVRQVQAVSIFGTGSYVPQRVVTNDEVGGPAGVDPEWIHSKTSIHQRRWVNESEATSDLAIEAGRRALKDAGISPENLSLIVVATSTPDHSQPPTASFVQRGLSAPHAAVFDMNAVCSGFAFALSTAEQMVSVSGGFALVIGADVYSRILNRSDRRTVILFGDGAGAAVIGPATQKSGHRILSSELHSFGDLSHVITVPASGSRMPYESGVADELRYFTMDGRAVRTFVTENLPGLVHRFLAANGLRREDVDHFVPHQANGVMLQDVFNALQMPNAKIHMTVEKFGNTGSASIPITLDHAAANNQFVEGDLILLAGFGGGMAVGLSLLRW
jgi:3-oxoacyl-[acyl-carrier-protein] synthase-3